MKHMKTTTRNDDTIKKYKNQLHRISGQIDGICKALDNSAYCLDLVNQINAIRGSLFSINKKLINEHIEHCVKHSKNLDESLNEIEELVDKLK